MSSFLLEGHGCCGEQKKLEIFQEALHEFAGQILWQPGGFSRPDQRCTYQDAHHFGDNPPPFLSLNLDVLQEVLWLSLLFRAP